MIKGTTKLIGHFKEEHPDERVFKCSECEYESHWLPNINSHMLGKHEKVGLKCDQCDYTNRWKQSLLEHKRFVHGVFMKDTKYKALITSAFQPSENICPLCGVSEESQFSFEQHVCGKRTQHLKYFKCEKCNHRTRYPYNLKAHQSIHNETNETISCDKCNYTTKQKHKLKAHRWLKHEGIKYSCEHCEYTCRIKERILQHTASVHKGATFSCDQCDVKMKWKNALDVHKRRKHPRI